VVVGRTLYVADAGNAQIRTVDLDAAMVGTYAGTGTAGGADGAALTTASFTTPKGLALASGNTMYVADAGTHTIRRIDGPDPNHAVTTVAGKGALGFLDADGTNAAFNAPSGLVVGTDGNLYVADTGNHLIRRIDLASAGKTVTTWAGVGVAGFFDGPPSSAKFSTPVGLAWLGSGLVVADSGNFRVRQIQ
jgi:sugar lactone lactonase YvrE